MPLPALTPAPPAPSRSMTADEFVAAADAFVAWQENFPDELNAYAAALIVGYAEANYNSTSATSLAIGTGSKTFLIETGKLFDVGQWVTAASAADVSNYMAGQVTAYDAVTGDLTVNVTVTGGAGTKADWIITLSGPQGPEGPSGGAGTFLELVGGTMTGPLVTEASAPGGAGLTLPQGAAPTTPANGDVWTTAAGLFARIAGATLQFLSTAGGAMLGPLALTNDSVIEDADGVDRPVGFRNLPQNEQNGNYTIDLTDEDGHVYSQNTGAQQITIPTNAVTAFLRGTTVTIVNDGTTAITIKATGITLKQAGTSNVGDRTLAANGWATILKVGTDKWFIGGVGLT